MYFLVNAYSPKPLDVVTSNSHRCIGHMMWKVLGNILCVLVNASPKPLDVTTSNFAGAYVT